MRSALAYNEEYFQFEEEEEELSPPSPIASRPRPVGNFVEEGEEPVVPRPFKIYNTRFRNSSFPSSRLDYPFSAKSPGVPGNIHFNNFMAPPTPGSRPREKYFESLLSLPQNIGLNNSLVRAGGLSIIGLLIGWLVLTNLLSLLQPTGQKKIYSFSPGSGSSPAAPQSPVKTGEHPVSAGPSISTAKIDAVLQQYKSPAAGNGQAFYDLGVKYGIDPAFALAFFIHESSAGTQGVATITRSIGNIRCTQGYDCYQTAGNGAFRKYQTWSEGIEDWYKLLKDLYVNKWGLKTLEQIIPVYAPSADHNSPDRYIQQVAGMVENWRN